MRDSDAEYPLHQPRRGSNGHEDIYDDQSEDDVRGRRQRPQRPVRRQPTSQYEEIAAPELPQGRYRNALIAGVIAGVLCSTESIIIAFANTGMYQDASKYGAKNLPMSLAFTLVGIACLSFFLGLLICFIAGFVTGKVAVQRRLGFLAGFIAGIVTYAISFLLNYIPNYPGHIAGSGTANAGIVVGGIVVILILFLIWGVVAGLVSLLGAWIATRKHSYYVG